MALLKITQNEDALNRFFLIAPELASLNQTFQDGYCIKGNHPTTREHYQLIGSMAVRMFNNSSVIKEGGGNQFLCKATKLMNMSSNMEIPETAKEDILLEMTRVQTNLKSLFHRDELHLQQGSQSGIR